MPLTFGSKEANDILARETGRRFDLADVDPLSRRHNPGLDAPAEDDYTARHCTICGSFMDWVDCWQCGGDGEFDLYDEDPINYAPGAEYEPCDACKGKGGYYECASLPHEEGAKEPL